MSKVLENSQFRPSKFLSLSFLALLTIGCGSDSPSAPAESEWCKTEGNCGTFTDARDGKEYKWTKIHWDTWMAENLNYHGNAVNAVCYSNRDADCEQYGAHYSWADAQLACPDGWHLPTEIEWSGMLEFTGGWTNAANPLKSTFGWHGSVQDGLDLYGFTALPGGMCDGDNCSHSPSVAYWWTATESLNSVDESVIKEENRAVYRRLHVGSYGMVDAGSSFMSTQFSVRCLKNN